MLSYEADDLAALVLARHSLICRAIELEADPTISAPIDAADALDRRTQELLAELVLIPGMLEELDAAIGAGWDRLRFRRAAEF